MPDTKTFQGGCHCGRVRFRATTAIAELFECNCSICSKRGALWAFVKAPQFELVQGQDALADYQFNRKVIHHLFCRSCGVGAFSKGESDDGSVGYGINVRCLDDVDVGTLTLTPYDGKTLL